MRIAILCTATTLHQQGGTEVHAEAIAAGAAARGHSVHIITSHHPDRPETEVRGGISTHYLPGTDFSMSRKALTAWWELSALKIKELASGPGLDIIWAENYTGQYYASRLRKELGIPVISFLGGLGVFDDIRSNFSRISTPGEALYFATRYLAQAALHLCPWQYNAVHYSDHTVTVSQASRQAVLREISVPEGRITAIYPPVDTRLFRPDTKLRGKTRETLKLGARDLVLLMSGVVHKQKGFELGLKAFFALERPAGDLKLVIAGDGPERGRLEQLAASRKNKSVFFTGTVPNCEMPGIYNAADIYLNPTIRREGLSIVTVEAMACALPSVVSRIGGTVETIEEGLSGFFTRPGNIAELKQKTLAILENTDLVRKMGFNARKRSVDIFSADKSMTAILDLSDKVIKRAGTEI
ncbi:MAG: glycosyltransferase family 4 protein [Elusimicrobiales bacterium]|nr:glycosyltransferase family 4 protein [Elusimicrobiales bacterium]